MPNPADAKKAFAKVLRENGFQGSAPTFGRDGDVVPDATEPCPHERGHDDP